MCSGNRPHGLRTHSGGISIEEKSQRKVLQGTWDLRAVKRHQSIKQEHRNQVSCSKTQTCQPCAITNHSSAYIIFFRGDWEHKQRWRSALRYKQFLPSKSQRVRDQTHQLCEQKLFHYSPQRCADSHNLITWALISCWRICKSLTGWGEGNIHLVHRAVKDSPANFSLCLIRGAVKCLSKQSNETQYRLSPSSKLAKTSDVLHGESSSIQVDLESPHLNSTAERSGIHPAACLGPVMSLLFQISLC